MGFLIDENIDGGINGRREADGHYATSFNKRQAHTFVTYHGDEQKKTACFTTFFEFADVYIRCYGK